MKQVWNGKHWETGHFIQITVENGVIVGINDNGPDSKAHWIAPGLIDIQVNGIDGFDLNSEDSNVDTVQGVVRALHRSGVTRFCPTVVTGTRERMLHCLSTIVEACESDYLVDHAVLGIHVEGPFISPEDGPRGAHQRDWVRNPDWEEFLKWQEAAKGRIRKVTLAPERPGAISFIKQLVEVGVVAAIGHTSASESDIQMAVEAGSTMSTHLGNGAHSMIKRHPNYIWAQLAEDRLWAGFIPDGHHLPVSALKVMIRAKGKKAILTSDAVSLAGLPPGRYATNIHPDVILEPNGFLHLADTPDILAGAATSLNSGIVNVVQSGICSIDEAIKLASLHPAELFGMGEKGVGRIEIGSPADFILYTSTDKEPFAIKKTVSMGAAVYQLEEE